MNTKNDNDGDKDCNTFDQHVSKLVFMPLMSSKHTKTH